MQKTTKNRLEQVFRGMIYILPGVLFFSYQPLMHFGSSESMNFEISLPLVWLVLFDVLVLIMSWQKRGFWKGILQRWMWLLLPLWLTISVLWSLNSIRGLLTVGIVWLLYFAIYGFFELRKAFDKKGFRDNFWKVFFGSSLVICVWCWVQCILDLVGVPREASLMCEGCVSGMFGFPHPDGFAIEPQFMGNLLLAPTIIAGWLMLCSRPRPAGPSPRAAGANSRAAALRNAASPKHHTTLSDCNFRKPIIVLLFFVLSVTLFLTFSRGAIYAFLVAMVVMTIWRIIQSRKWKALLVWPVIILAFLFTLNTQGIMAAASSTNDTYKTGVAKVLNHLSLGVIDIRDNAVPVEETEVNEGSTSDNQADEATFSGYVAESTDTRLRLSGAAVKIWSQDFATAMFGVGLGGAGQALYINDLSPAPKEIVQNQYASLLLETGVIGVVLVVFSLVMVLKVFWKSPLKVVLICLLIAYGISLLFFSGLPNALHIYLLPALIYSIGLRKKLVS